MAVVAPLWWLAGLKISGPTSFMLFKNTNRHLFCGPKLEIRSGWVERNAEEKRTVAFTIGRRKTIRLVLGFELITCYIDLAAYRRCPSNQCQL